MDPADIIRERVSIQICSRYKLSPFVMNTPKGVTVLCCCKQFADQLKTDFDTSLSNDMHSNNCQINFVAGKLDFV